MRPMTETRRELGSAASSSSEASGPAPIPSNSEPNVWRIQEQDPCHNVERKRRHSEPEALAAKRLTNGFGKTDQVRTRAQAKADPSARLSPARKPGKGPLSGEERRLEISMRLRHEEKAFTRSPKPTNHQISVRRTSLKFRLTGRKTNGLGPARDPPSPPPARDKGTVAEKRAREAESREARARKRRSALWVLNCEAEEFLFGETAAEDHEVELPPMSPPPRKRRRMRATELGELLKETPLLESKLRNGPSSCSGSEESGSRGQKRRRLDGTEDLDSPRSPTWNEIGLSPPISSSSLLDYAPASQPSASHSVRMQSILASLQWKFSFEEVPTTETWFKTFSRQDNPRYQSSSPSSSCPSPAPLILPYETKAASRSPKKIKRPPRKSPRCHASTQAILSSLKPSRASKVSPPPPAATPAVPKASASRPKALPRLNRHLFSNSSPPVVCPPAPNISAALRAAELSGTDYIWDSLQFLSDPYVVQVLASASLPVSRSPERKVRCSSPLRLLIPSPKTSPRTGQGGGRTGCEGGNGRLKSPLVSPSSVRKSPRKSPLVVVSDILKNGRLPPLPEPAQEDEVGWGSGDGALPDLDWALLL